MHVGETRAFGRAHQRPVTVGFDPLHEQVGDPQGVEEVPSSDFFLSVILSQVEEVENVGVPWLDVNGECTRSLVTALIDVSGSGIEGSEHGDDTVRVAVCSGDIRPLGTDVVDVKTDTSCGLGDLSAGLESLVDPFDRIVSHSDEETRRHLRVGCTSVEEGRGCMGEVSLRHEIVSLDDSINVACVDTDGNAHDHVLGSFDDLAVDSEEVGALKGLEAKVVVCKVAIVNDDRVE